MILQRRIDWLSKLGNYMLSNEPSWKEAKQKASAQNGWFACEFVELAAKNIAENFLRKEMLETWTANYRLPGERPHVKSIGIAMAGNIPLVGFHDLLSVFVCGHQAIVKPSSKDDVLIKHLVAVLSAWDPAIRNVVRFSEILRKCDAYLATGSNNTARYFEYYFRKYPHIIRRNKTSVAVLNGNETGNELEKLADDVHQFFGLGCRNVTKIYTPIGYDFEPLLKSFKKYNYLADNHKYKNNYDYGVAIHILNNKFYMTSGSVLLVQDASLFSPISQLHYDYYTDADELLSSLHDNDEIQCIVGHRQIPFGRAQCPSLFDYSDKADTMTFLLSL